MKSRKIRMLARQTNGPKRSQNIDATVRGMALKPSFLGAIRDATFSVVAKARIETIRPA